MDLLELVFYRFDTSVVEMIIYRSEIDSLDSEINKIRFINMNQIWVTAFFKLRLCA